MKNEKRKILIIGVGGIGSHIVPLLYKTGCYYIYIADPDTVDWKNIPCQNYNAFDVKLKKVNAMKKNLVCTRTGSDHGIGGAQVIEFPILTKQQITGFDLIICCADNLDVRKLIYKEGFQDDCKSKWLDLRAQGRNGAIISYLTDPKFCDTFLAGPEGSFSCQGESYNESNDTTHIHFTHVAIAGIGAQWVQRWFNGEEVKDKLIINI